MLNFNIIANEIERGNQLLILLLDVVIKTHSYEDMEDEKKRLDELR